MVFSLFLRLTRADAVGQCRLRGEKQGGEAADQKKRKGQNTARHKGVIACDANHGGDQGGRCVDDRLLHTILRLLFYVSDKNCCPYKHYGHYKRYKQGDLTSPYAPYHPYSIHVAYIHHMLHGTSFAMLHILYMYKCAACCIPY